MPTATLNGPAETPPIEIRRPTGADPIEVLWEEISGYHAAVRQFQNMEPDQVLLEISGYAARAGEIRAHLARSQHRSAVAFKNNVVEPFLNDLDFQYRLHSRVQAVREWDLKLTGGAP